MEVIRGADYVSGLGDIVILGQGGQKTRAAMAAPVAPALPGYRKLSLAVENQGLRGSRPRV